MFMCVYIYIPQDSFIICQILRAPLLSPRTHFSMIQCTRHCHDGPRIDFMEICSINLSGLHYGLRRMLHHLIIETKRFLNFCNCLGTARICTFSKNKSNSSYITLHRSFPT